VYPGTRTQCGWEERVEMGQIGIYNDRYEKDSIQSFEPCLRRFVSTVAQLRGR
jgi:hypothetical protein